MTSSPTFSRYVALGDSYTEGVGDELPDGRLRGWADFVALGLQAAAAEPIGYANLAIRGRKPGQIITEQVEPALAHDPDLITFNGRYSMVTYDGSHFSQLGRIFNASLQYRF